MPPVPKSSQKFAGSGSSSSRSRERVSDEIGGIPGDFSSGPRSKPISGAPRSQKPGRQTKEDILREQIGRMYFMIGAMVKPLGRFYPAMDKIGANCQEVSADAAEAWMDLAQKDPKVKDALEKMVGASAWGNVIGIHLIIFATAIPGGEFLSQGAYDSGEHDAVMAEARSKLKGMGLSDEDIEQAMKMVNQEFGQGEPLPDIPVQENGSPSPTSAIQTPGEQGAVNVDSPDVGDVD